MAKWTISQYSKLPVDAAGNPLPIYSNPRDTDGHVAAGSQVIANGARYARFCGDTAAHVKVGSGASAADPFVPAGAEFVVDVSDATEISFIVA